MIRRSFYALALLAVAPACTHLQSVSVTQIPADRSRPVRAEVNNPALFGIHFDNSFVEDLTPQLMAQCPHGRLTGLLTKYENTTYVLVSTRTVITTGYCVYDAAPVVAAAPQPTLRPQPPTPPETAPFATEGP
jgi:hypothetical protein